MTGRVAGIEGNREEGLGEGGGRRERKAQGGWRKEGQEDTEGVVEEEEEEKEEFRVHFASPVHLFVHLPTHSLAINRASEIL